ncbi:MAG: hypothetical protein Q4D21_05680 [Phascolarctobacterium sp.]|nr:hypothetical protein [Phascolarctobacterium sp.]
MKNILDALELFKNNPADVNLLSAMRDALDERIDELENIIPKNEDAADALDDEIDAVSEMADLLFALEEEVKTYAKALKVNSEADASKVQEIILELKNYLEEYEENLWIPVKHPKLLDQKFWVSF